MDIRGLSKMPIDSEKSKQAEAKLPSELKPIYHQMVQDYEFQTQVKYGRVYVTYEVLAWMVLTGWRPSAEPQKSAISKNGDGQ